MYLSGKNPPRHYEEDYIGWWLFVLEKHPSRALKCGLADWYMKQGGDENRKRALKLLEESAKEGFGLARQKLAAL